MLAGRLRRHRRRNIEVADLAGAGHAWLDSRLVAKPISVPLADMAATTARDPWVLQVTVQRDELTHAPLAPGLGTPSLPRWRGSSGAEPGDGSGLEESIEFWLSCGLGFQLADPLKRSRQLCSRSATRLTSEGSRLSTGSVAISRVGITRRDAPHRSGIRREWLDCVSRRMWRRGGSRSGPPRCSWRWPPGEALRKPRPRDLACRPPGPSRAEAPRRGWPSRNRNTRGECSARPAVRAAKGNTPALPVGRSGPARNFAGRSRLDGPTSFRDVARRGVAKLEEGEEVSALHALVTQAEGDRAGHAVSRCGWSVGLKWPSPQHQRGAAMSMASCACGAVGRVVPPDFAYGNGERQPLMQWTGGCIAADRIAIENARPGVSACPLCQCRSYVSERRAVPE